MRYPGDYLYCILHSPVPMFVVLGIVGFAFCWIDSRRKKTRGK